MEQEVRDTLARHGMSAEDIERVAEFEAAHPRKPRKRAKIVQESLDFGDWA